jgi:hypothetical protein
MPRLCPFVCACLLACEANPPLPPAAATGFGVGSLSFLDRAADATGPDAPVSPVAATAPQPVPVEGDDPVRAERELRERLTGSDPAAAALALAALLADHERHDEAWQVLTTVRGKVADPRLDTALAFVERDLGRRAEAIARLRELRNRQGAAALHPGLLFALGELEWLAGDRAGARGTLDELQRVHAADAWLAAHEAELAGLGRELAGAPQPRTIATRDLLGDLRGAPSVVARMRTLERLLALARSGEGAQHPGLERRVLAIAAGDEAAVVRARAVQLGPPEPEQADAAALHAFCRAALADGDALVRDKAAARTAELLGADAVLLLLEALARETDAKTFRALDAALAALAGVAATTLDAADPAARTATVKAWEQRWQR